MRAPLRHVYPIALIVIVSAGLALRLLSAQGGLWLDEAWSASFARDVGTPLGVFLSIHHDNNHHLNTLWMQLVGFDAPPIVQRALSIITGTAAIVVTAMIARPRGVAAALVTSGLFAISPILVTYGSEARGYAPMILALLCLILVGERWADDHNRPAPLIAAIGLCILGVLSQMTMAFGVLAVGGWLLVAVGARRAAPLVAVMVTATGLSMAAIVWGLPGPAGFGFGAYAPFTAHDLFDGVRDMSAFTLGLPRAGAVIAIPLILLALRVRLGPDRLALYGLALIGLPSGIALLHIGNAGMARYYLTAAVALLLLASEVLVAAKGRQRWLAGLALAAIVAGSVAGDFALMQDRRADPGRAVDLILSGSPIVTLDRPRAAPIIESAAARRGRTVRIAKCAPWLFIDRDGAEPFPDRPERCGYTYLPVASASPTGLSGTHWRLYRRDQRCADDRPAA